MGDTGPVVSSIAEVDARGTSGSNPAYHSQSGSIKTGKCDGKPKRRARPYTPLQKISARSKITLVSRESLDILPLVIKTEDREVLQKNLGYILDIETLLKHCFDRYFYEW